MEEAKPAAANGSRPGTRADPIFGYRRYWAHQNRKAGISI